MIDSTRFRVLAAVLIAAVLAMGAGAGCGQDTETAVTEPAGTTETVETVETAEGGVLVVIADDDVNEAECDAVLLALAGTGRDVVVANSSGGDSEGSTGRVYPVDAAVGDVGSSDFEAVVFVGGMGASRYFEDGVVLSLVRAMEAEGKLVAAVCIAPVILANAGVLRGRNATVARGGVEALEAGGAVFVDEPVVVDGDIITGRDPDAADEFARAVGEALLADTR